MLFSYFNLVYEFQGTLIYENFSWIIFHWIAVFQILACFAMILVQLYVLRF